MNAADSELVRPLRANAYHQTGVPSTSAFKPLRPTWRPSTRKSVLAIVLSDLRAEVHLASACQSLTSQRRKAEPSPPRVKCAKCHGTRLDCPNAHGRCSFSPNLCLEAFVFTVSCVFFVRVGLRREQSAPPHEHHRKYRWEPSRHCPRGPRRPLPISLEVAHQCLQIHLDMPLDVSASYE